MSAKVVVITGATRGLGRALTDRFVEAGWNVAGCGRDAAAIESLAKAYRKPHHFGVVDVTDVSTVEKWARQVEGELGPPDLLVNNAAVINQSAPLWEIEPDDFAGVMAINLNGVFHSIRAFVPAMVARKSGVIVNLSSGWGRSTARDVAPYCGSKWGIEGLTKALAQDLPKGMAAVPLNPGIINTEMLQSTLGAGASSYPSPEQWSRTAAPFLMGLTSRHNGQSLTVPDIPA